MDVASGLFKCYLVLICSHTVLEEMLLAKKKKRKWKAFISIVNVMMC